MISRTTSARALAPALFVVAAAVEVARIVTARPWPSFTADFSNVLGGLLAALWLASALVVAMRTKTWVAIPVFGTFMLLTMGVVYRAGGALEGVLYMGFAPVITLLERYSFAGFLDPSALPQERRRSA